MIDKYCNDPKPINRDQQAALGVKHTCMHIHLHKFIIATKEHERPVRLEMLRG